MNINSVFFIPMDVQDEVIGRLGRRNYLSSATGTNNRGIEIRTSAVTNLRNHERTLSFAVDWRIKSIKYPTPWDEWVKYWNNL